MPVLLQSTSMKMGFWLESDAHSVKEQDFQTENILWRECNEEGTKWIVQLFFPDRPDLFLCCNIKECSYKSLSEKFQEKIFCTRKIYTYKADDKSLLSGILTFPPSFSEKKKYPLIVFPHGGPQTRSMLSFDARTEFLGKKGFLVFQPNYRGSTGAGKFFRQQAWKAKGIKRSLDDIAQGTLSLIQKRYADKEKVFIFGGSWGGYCALALTAFYPNLYKAATVFFGVSDLTAMLRENLPDSGSNKGWNILQYGDINKKNEMEELKKISPYFLAEKISAPILLYHFENDTVIAYAQSEKFVKKMKFLGKKIHFVSGKGSHSFAAPQEEEKAYLRMVEFFQKRMKNEK